MGNIKYPNLRTTTIFLLTICSALGWSLGWFLSGLVGGAIGHALGGGVFGRFIYKKFEGIKVIKCGNNYRLFSTIGWALGLE